MRLICLLFVALSLFAQAPGAVTITQTALWQDEETLICATFETSAANVNGFQVTLIATYNGNVETISRFVPVRRNGRRSSVGAIGWAQFMIQGEQSLVKVNSITATPIYSQSGLSTTVKPE